MISYPFPRDCIAWFKKIEGLVSNGKLIVSSAEAFAGERELGLSSATRCNRAGTRVIKHRISYKVSAYTQYKIYF